MRAPRAQAVKRRFFGNFFVKKVARTSGYKMKQFGCILVFVFTVFVLDSANGSEYFLPNTIIPNACTATNTGVYQGEFVMVPVYQDTIYTCAPGYYLPHLSEVCEKCPADSYCVGGDYTYSETVDSGIMSCASGLFAPSGMWQPEQCGHKLHIADVILYLRQTRQTEHTLNVQYGDTVFYGNMTTADVPINADTERRLRIMLNDTIYSVYDDTVMVDD